MLIRFVVFLLFDPGSVILGGDAVGYVNEARSLQAGIAPHFFRGAGYPSFLAAILPLGAWGVILVQCTITIASAVATWFILGRTSRALCTALFISACPFFAIYDFHLLSETLYIQLLWLGFLLMYRGRWTWAGLLIGLSAVVRDTLILLPLALLPLVLRDRRYALTAAVAAVLIVITPHGQGRMGLNLWIGTWERNGDWYLSGLSTPQFPDYAFRLPGERQTVQQAWMKDDAPLQKLAFERIFHDEPATAIAWIERYPRLWVGTRMDSTPMRFAPHSLAWTIFKLLFFGLNLLILALGGYGAVRERGLFVLPIAYVAVIYVPFHNCETRYSLPALTFLLYFAAGVVLHWFRVGSVMRNRISVPNSTRII